MTGLTSDYSAAERAHGRVSASHRFPRLRDLIANEHARVGLLIVGALGSTFFLTASMTGLAPVAPAIVAGACWFGLLLVRNRSWIVHSMLVVLFATSVPEVPRGIRVAGVFLYFYE